MKIWGYILKLIIAGALIFFLFQSHRLDFSQLKNVIVSSGSWPLIILGASFVFLGEIMLCLRLRLWLYNRIDVPFQRAFGLTLIGSFFGAVLPGVVSGDAVKTIYLFGDAKDEKHHAIAVVVMDRVIGLFSLFLLGTICAVCAGIFNSTLDWRILAISPVVTLGMILAGLVIALDLDLKIPLLKKLFSHIPGPILDVTGELRIFLKRPKRIFGAIGYSLGNHILVVFSIIIAAGLLQVQLPAFTHFVLSPLAMVLNVVPLTPGGIGLTEGAFSLLYETAGFDGGATLGLTGRFIQYFTFALAGTVAFLFVRAGKKKRED